MMCFIVVHYNIVGLCSYFACKELTASIGFLLYVGKLTHFNPKMKKSVLCTFIVLISLLVQVPYISGSKTSSCDSIRLEGPYIPTFQWLMGALYTRSNDTFNRRPVFDRQLNLSATYVYYCAECSRWIIGPTLGGTNATMYIRSNVSNPVEAKGVWYAHVLGMYRPFQNVSLRCLKKSCKPVILRGPYIQSQASIMGAVFTQTDERHDDQPVFKFGPVNNSVYIFYIAQNFIWVITRDYSTSNMTIELYARSTANHPAQVTRWYVYEKHRYHQRDDVTVECSKDESEPKNCSAVTLQGPFIAAQSALVGAVFKVHGMKDGRPVFEFSYTNYTANDDAYLFYDDATVSWRISSETNSTWTSIYALSTAYHPADITAVWWYVTKNGTWKATRNTSLVCSEVRTSASSKSCKIIEFFKSPYGRRFLRKTDAIMNGRPVYVIQMNKTYAAYLFYFEDTTQWFIGISLGHPKNVIASVKSKETNPAKIRGMWYFALGNNTRVHWVAFKDAYIRCKQERSENCSSVRITGIEKLKLPGVSKDVYRQIATDVNHRPIFYVRDSNATSYIYHGIDKDQIGFWSVGPSLNSSATLKSPSDDQHPSESINPWTMFDKGNIADIYNEIHIDCATAQDNGHLILQSDPGTVIAVVSTAVVFIVCAIVFGYIWSRKRYLLSNLFQPYEEFEDAQFDVFICYKSGGAGQRIALDYLVPLMENDWGLSVAKDVPNYLPGCEFVETEAALENLGSSRRIILVLTFDFLDCRWCNIKCTSALVQREKRLAAIVPLLLEDVSTSDRRSQKLRTIMNISKCLRIPSTFEGSRSEQFRRSLRKALPNIPSTRQETKPCRQESRSENTVLEGPRVDAMEKELQELASSRTQENDVASMCIDPSKHNDYSESTL